MARDPGWNTRGFHQMASRSCWYHGMRPSGCGMLRQGTCCNLLSRDITIGYEHWVMSVAFLRDSKRIVSASHDKTIQLWDAEMGTCCNHLSRDMRIWLIVLPSHQTASALCRHHVTWLSECGMLRRGTCCNHLLRDIRVWSALLRSCQMASALFRHQVTRPSGCGMLMQRTLHTLTVSKFNW